MKQNGNKFLSLLLAVMICFTSCTMTGDWCYRLLPGDYEVLRINSTEIDLVQDGGYVIRYVIAFCYNESFIGVQQPEFDKESNDDLDIREMDWSNPNYYLVDAANEAVYGPYTATEYEDQLKKLNITDMCEWISTNTKPKGAVW